MAADQPIAEFRVREGGRHGTLRVFPDRIERSSGISSRRRTGWQPTPFRQIRIVTLTRRVGRRQVRLDAVGTLITLRVDGNAAELVAMITAGVSGRLATPPEVSACSASPPPSARPAAGPPPRWCPEPHDQAARSWWDGLRRTTARA